MPRSMWDLSFQQGMELMPPAMQVKSPNYWTTGEFPSFF